MRAWILQVSTPFAACTLRRLVIPSGGGIENFLLGSKTYFSRGCAFPVAEDLTKTSLDALALAWVFAAEDGPRAIYKYVKHGTNA